MSKITKISLILLLLLAAFNKKIISYYLINKFASWVERPVNIEKFLFNYSGYLEIEGLSILNKNQNYYKNIFEAEKIQIYFDTKSLFSDLIVIEKLIFINPEFFLDISILKNNKNHSVRKNIYLDNIGLAKKINENMPDKIWPKKNKDINFIVNESILTGAIGNIKISSISAPAVIKLSEMKFSSFGNDKSYRHYKDVLNSILYDLYARTKKIKLKNTLKKIYKF